MASLQDAAKLKELEQTYGLTPEQAQKALDIAKTEQQGFKAAAEKAKATPDLKSTVLGAKPAEPGPAPMAAPAPSAETKAVSLAEQVSKAKAPAPVPAAGDIPAPSGTTVQQRVEDKKGLNDITKNIRGQVKQEDIKPVNLVQQSLANIDQQIGGVDKTYAPKLQAIAEQIQAKEKQIQSAEDRKAWLQLASQLGAALTQYGAARYGMKHGVDMSGIKVEPANIEAAMGYQFTKLNKDLDNLLKKQEGTEAAIVGEKADLAKQRAGILEEERKAEGLKEERAFRAGEAEKARAFTAEQNRLAREAAQTKLEAKDMGLKLTPAEKKADEAYGKIYADRLTSGKTADAEKQIKQLTDVMDELEKTKEETFAGTGKIALIPKAVRDVFGARSSAMQDRVEDIVQRSARAILGAQFTEKEGKNLTKRAFNPAQTVDENMYRLENLVNQLKSAEQANRAAADYFEQNGTLKGFKGKVYTSADDFDLEATPAPKEDASKAARRKKWEELRAKKAGG